MNEIYVLHIEEEEVQARAFEWQILKHSKLESLGQIHLINKTSLADSLAWLETSGIQPYIICIDLGLPDLPRHGMSAIVDQFLRYVADKSSIIGLTKPEMNDEMVRALERKLGRQQIFSNQAVFEPVQQAALIQCIKEIVAQRSTGSTRTLMVNLAKLEEKVDGLEEATTKLSELIDRVNTILFVGAGDGKASVAYMAMQHENQIKELQKKQDDLEKEQSEAKLQLRLELRKSLLKWVGYGLLVLLCIFAVKFLDIKVDQLLDVIKAVFK